MSTTGLQNQMAAWCERYPDPSAPAERNAVARADEDKRLIRYSGASELDRDQVIDLINWKFQSMPHRRTLALRGVSPERWHGTEGASNLIRQALITDDDTQAMATVCRIYRFGPAMSSVILAACRPQRFTIADSKALKTLRALDRMPDGPEFFRTRDWPRYLTACRNLAGECGLSLRDTDRALWVGADQPT